MYRIAFLLLFSFGLMMSCSNHDFVAELPFYNNPDFTPYFFTNTDEMNQEIDHRIAHFSMLNQDSVTITDAVIDNKIHVASFIFTSCGSICPVLTANMKRASNRFINDDDVVFLSFSVTPWIDTPSKLQSFAKEYSISDPNWHFLTGNKSEIYSLARTSYFAEEQLGFTKDSTEFLHTEHFILVDSDKHIRGIYNGTLELEVNQLIEDITTLKGGSRK